MTARQRGQDRRVLVEVDVGLVGEPDSGPFGQRDGGLVEGEEPDRAVAVVGPVEAHRVATVIGSPFGPWYRL